MTTAPQVAPLALPWRDSPVVRVIGSFVSWFGFALCFSLLYLSSYTVMSMGGYCASGGPYVIETECPAAVVAFAPLSIFGGLLAVAVSVFLAQGFGAQLVAWAWPILFVGLSVPFFISAYYGNMSGWFLGVMFAVMGLGPVWLYLKSGGGRSAILGTRNARGDNFTDQPDEPAYRLIGRRAGVSTDPQPATAADWALALGVLVVAAALGVTTANALWHAV